MPHGRWRDHGKISSYYVYYMIYLLHNLHTTPTVSSSGVSIFMHKSNQVLGPNTSFYIHLYFSCLDSHDVSILYLGPPRFDTVGVDCLLKLSNISAFLCTYNNIKL